MKEIIFIYNFADELLYFNKIIENKDLNIKYLYDYDAKDVKEIMQLEYKFKTKLKPLILIKEDNKYIKAFKQGPYSHEKKGPEYTAIESFKNYLNAQERVSNNS